MGKKIYVGKISFRATAEAVNSINEGHAGRSKGFGFVEMASEEGAQRKITALNGTTSLERTLSVAEAKNLREQKDQVMKGKEREAVFSK